MKRIWALILVLGIFSVAARGRTVEVRNRLTPGLTALSIGWGYSCAILTDGNTKCWGWNNNGQLGLGDRTNRGDRFGQMGSALPAVDLGTGRHAMSVSAGWASVCAILDDDSLKCWGTNDFGQLGLGDRRYRGGSSGEMGDALPAVDVGSGRKARSVSVGGRHACAVLDDQTVKCWGANDLGQLGLGDTISRGNMAGQMGDQLKNLDLGKNRKALSIACGYDHSCVLLDDLSVKCWGLNDRGQLGQGDTLNRGARAGQMGDQLAAIDLGSNRRAKSISVGGSITCVNFSDGQSKCFGLNDYGTLGLEDNLPRGSSAGQMSDHLPWVNVEPGLMTKEIGCGYYHCCGLLQGGLVKCWGRASYGALGNGDRTDYGATKGSMGTSLPFVDLGKMRSASSLAVGVLNTCAILDSGDLKCWGDNSQGQLGLGDSADRGATPETVPSQISAIDL